MVFFGVPGYKMVVPEEEAPANAALVRMDYCHVREFQKRMRDLDEDYGGFQLLDIIPCSKPYELLEFIKEKMKDRMCMGKVMD